MVSPDEGHECLIVAGAQALQQAHVLIDRARAASDPGKTTKGNDGHRRGSEVVRPATGRATPVSRCAQEAAIPSPPMALGTVTLPIAVSAPSPAARNASTIPCAPVWT